MDFHERMRFQCDCGCEWSETHPKGTHTGFRHHVSIKPPARDWVEVRCQSCNGLNVRLLSQTLVCDQCDQPLTTLDAATHKVQCKPYTGFRDHTKIGMRGPIFESQPSD